jgi:hypothetical protein
MISLGDLTKIWKWTFGKLWHLPIAVVLTSVLLIVFYLEFFIKTEDRYVTMIDWYSQLANLFSTQLTGTVYYAPLIKAAILTVLTMSAIFILLFYSANTAMNNRMNDKDKEISVLNVKVDEQTAKINEQKQAYIRLRHAYKKAAGITTRETSYDIGVSSVNDGSTEHLQQLGEFELYMEAERLARSAGIPEDA